MERRRKTRNEIKREAIKNVVMSIAVIIMLAVMTVWAIGIWEEHPGETPVNGAEYLANLQD